MLGCGDSDLVARPVNLISPNPIPNAEIMRTLRQVFDVPFGLPATNGMIEGGAYMLRIETELLIKSRRVIPGACSNPASSSSSLRFLRRSSIWTT